MATLKGSQTEKNLLKAFAGESQARNRYAFFSSQAKKDGYEQIAWIFADTADNEKEHAKRFFTFLKGGDVEITASYPAGPISTTAANLKEAAAGEHMEWGTLYPDFADVAEKEGFSEIASVFRNISSVESGHEKEIPRPSREYRKGEGLQERWLGQVALQELRLHPRRSRSACGMPCLRPPPGLL